MEIGGVMEGTFFFFFFFSEEADSCQNNVPDHHKVITLQ